MQLASLVLDGLRRPCGPVRGLPAESDLPAPPREEVDEASVVM